MLRHDPMNPIHRPLKSQPAASDPAPAPAPSVPRGARPKLVEPDAGGFAELQVGAKLRHARRVRGLRLKELAERVGCSESMLSKVENEQVRPSLKMLHRLAQELETSIGALFGRPSEDAGIVMRKAERPSISISPVGREGPAGVRIECLLPDPVDKLLYASIHVVEPGGGSEGTIEHQGEEVGYVLEGEFELTVDGRTYHLRQGDSFFFASNLPHGYRNPGRTAARVVWVNTPSTF
jgi:transcriptional regulator with XRE-family HTH domain